MEGDIIDAGELRVIVVHLRDLLPALLGGDLIGRQRRQARCTGPAQAAHSSRQAITNERRLQRNAHPPCAKIAPVGHSDQA